MKKRMIQMGIIGAMMFPEAFSAAAADPDYYNEDHRPKYHFTPEANWMNDPNGMVYYAGNIICFINIIHMACAGGQCIGGTR